MKHIKLLKSLIIVAPVLALASPLIILSNTGCGKIHGYSPDGSNWVGRTSGTLDYSIDTSNHTCTIMGNENFTADSTFTIPRAVVVDNEEYLVTTIDSYAFYLCTGLTGVDFGSVTTIGNCAFSGCTRLTQINLNNVTLIHDDAFRGCPLGKISVDLDNSVYKIVGSSYSGFIQKRSDGDTLSPVCGIFGGIACRNIVIPGNVTAISSYAFQGCAGLTRVDFGNVTTIGDYAFRECTGMTGMALNNVTTIGDEAFFQCPFHQISVDPDNSVYKLEGTSASGFIRNINDTTTTLSPVCGTTSGIACGNITIPAGVTTIAGSAFRGCRGLTGVDLGSTTTIGDEAFNGCEGLAGVDFGSVTTIGDEAFAGCIGLTKANLAVVTSIGVDAFNLCPIGEISVSADNSTFELIGTSTSGFIKKISDSATLSPICGSEGGIACGNITFSGNVTTIGNRAFWGCTGLTGVNFGSVTTIGNYAFRECTGMTEVDFGSVTTIGGYAFYECTWLTGVDLSSVTTLGYDWCCYCWNLSSVTIGTQTYISNDEEWDRVGPATNCILYAPDVSYANTFKTSVIGAAYANKWTYQQI